MTEMKEMYNKLKIGDLVIESYKTHSEIIEVDSLVLHYLEKWKDNNDRNKKKYNFLLLRDYHLNNCREIYNRARSPCVSDQLQICGSSHT